MKPKTRFERNGHATAVLDVRETAAFLAVTVDTVYRLTRKGELPHVRVGTRAIRYRVVDLETYLEKRTTTEWNETKAKRRRAG